jgi:glycosyltransferase involved in cell wall biosynthesis
MVKKEEKIRFSIIIPVFNGETYVERAIKSAISQNYSNFEVIVTDNHSTDKSAEICKKYLKFKNFKYFRNKENIGMVLNWRAGIKKAHADYFLILSDDDYLTDKDYLKKAAKKFSENKNAVLLHSDYTLYYEEENKFLKVKRNLKEVWSGKKYFLKLKETDEILPILCSTFFKLSLAKKINLFNDNSITASDLEAFFKFCLHGDVIFLKDNAAVYSIRRFSINNSSNVDGCIKNMDWIKNVSEEASKFLKKREIAEWKQKILIRSSEGIITKAIQTGDRKRIIKTINILITEWKLPWWIVFYKTTPIRLTLALINFKLYLAVRKKMLRVYLFLKK